ncbi:unnamed protein product [Mytilus coruscus]|uniref:Uncharacterized protein n=1 Tax=Mytilus coruscus TaxID=42192 RepID=A0A6J8A9F7_MYTCO|nr:unnamed protein product [Mytilus coruscus]
MEYQYMEFIQIFLFISVAISVKADVNECNALSCSDCFLLNPKCAWCASPDFEGGEWERCQNVRKFRKSCPKKELFTTNETPNLQKNKIEENLVSISKATINLRQNASVSFPLTVLVPRNTRRRKENVLVGGWKSNKKPVELTIESDCKNGRRKGNKFVCRKVKKGQQVTFELTTRLKNCLDKPRGRYNILVKIGKAKKIVKVDIRYICQCKVINNRNYEKKCSYNTKRNVGDGNCVLQATVVEAPPPEEEDILDVNLECPFSKSESENICRSPRIGNGENKVCSGKGECICGLCKCNNMYLGKFCECSDNTCHRHNGFLCGGRSKGQCKCGECHCREGYTGNNCGCPTTNATCIATDGSICNKNGFCICGKCRCNRGYNGLTCEDCPTCVPTCRRFKQCAECLAEVGHIMPRTMCRTVCKGELPEYSIVQKLSEKEDAKICYFVGQDGCPLNFEVLYSSKDFSSPEVRIEKRTECMTSQKCRSDDQCIALNGSICNRKGQCNCGYCECQSGYSGSTCEECTGCNDVCEQYRSCATCGALTKSMRCKRERKCSNITKVSTMDGDLGQMCQYRDPGSHCIVNYAVKFQDGQATISVLDKTVGCKTGHGPLIRADLEFVPNK